MINNPVNKLIVEDNAIKPISDTFAKLGGQSHNNGGTMVSVRGTGNVVEAQRNEPVSTQTDGSVVAWGKMKNPHTGNTFEKDANILSELENRVAKTVMKASDLISNEDNALSFTTGKVLNDAALQRDIDTTLKKEIYAKTQQDILDVSEVVGVAPDKFAKNMAKNGGVLGSSKAKVRIKSVPKANDGRTLSTPEEIAAFKQYDPRLQQVIGENLPYLDMSKIQPRDQLFGQRTNTSQGTFGNAYPEAFNQINLIQDTWGLPQYNWDTPDNVGTFQSEYNQSFNRAIGSNFFEGSSDPKGVDKKAGNLTSSTPTLKRTFGGLENRTLTIDEISAMSDDEFKAVSGYDKAKFAAMNPNLTAVSQYTFSPDMNLDYMGNVPLQQSNVTLPSLNPTVANAPVASTAGVRATPQETQIDRPSLADRNRLNLMNVLPELNAILDQPDYVQRQQYNPQYTQDYQVTFQDRINQNQADFNRVTSAMQDNPLALATVAAEKRRADSQVLAEEFRMNQAVSSNVANQNIQTYNQAQMQNIGLADQQFMRQEQARVNTDAARQRALTSISGKVQQKEAENNAIRLVENMSNFRVDRDMNAVNLNDAATIRTANGEIIELSPEELEVFRRERNQRTNTTKKFGGFFK